MKRGTYIILFIMLSISANAQDSLRFSVPIDDGFYAWSTSIMLEDSNYIVITSSQIELNPWREQYVLTKHNKKGEILIQKTFINPDSIVASGGKLVTHDSGYAVSTGYDRVPNQNQWTKLWVFDSLLDTVFTREYEDFPKENGMQYLNFDSQYYFFGGVLTAGVWDIIFARSNSSGDLTWSKEYLKSGDQIVRKIIQLENKFVISGYTDRTSSISPSGITRRGYLLQVDTLGNRLWDRVYENDIIPDYYLLFNDMVNSEDNNILIAGTQNVLSFMVGIFEDVETEGFLMKADSKGNPIWKIFPHIVGDSIKGYINNVRELPDGSILATGDRFTSTSGNLKGWSVKLSPIGTVLWQRYYDHYNVGDDNYLSDMQLTPDGGFIACGMTDSLGKPQDGWLLKADCNGCADSTCVAITDTCAVYNCLTDNFPIADFTLSADTLQLLDGTIMEVTVENQSSFSAAYQWQRDGVIYSSLVADTLLFNTAGAYEITLIARNQNCIDTLTKTVVVQEVDGIASLQEENTLHVYPNPANEVLFFDIESNQTGTVFILNSYSQIVKEQTVNENGTFSFLISDLPNGLYYLNVVTKNGERRHVKFIKTY